MSGIGYHNSAGSMTNLAQSGVQLAEYAAHRAAQDRRELRRAALEGALRCCGNSSDPESVLMAADKFSAFLEG